MKTYINPFLLIIVLTTTSYSFKKNDSLSQHLSTKYIDSIELLLTKAITANSPNPEHNLKYTNAALKIAQMHSNKYYEAKVLKTTGDIYRRVNFDKEALSYYKKTLGMSQQFNNSTLEAEVYISIADCFSKTSKYDTAEVLYLKSLALYEKNNDKPGIANCYIKFGNTQWYSSNYVKTLDYYLQALALYENLNNKAGIAKIQTNIGSLYTQIGNNQKAIFFLESSLQYYKNNNDPENQSELYYRLGIAHLRMKNYQAATGHFNAAKSIFNSLHNKRKVAFVELSEAEILDAKGNTDMAIALAQKALRTFNQYEFLWGNIEASNNLANYYMKKGELETAASYLNASLKTLTGFNCWELLKETYLGLSRLYDAKGDYKHSLVYFQKYVGVSDSLLNQQKNAKILELQARYESNKKEQEIQQKNQLIAKNEELIQKQKTHIYFFKAGIIIILILSCALYIQYLLLEKKGKKIELINLELDQRIKERTSELRLTQYSIEHAADPIFWINHAGQYMYVNNSACVTLNYTKEDLLKKKITDIIPEFSYHQWRYYWETTKRKGSLVVETTFKRKKRSEFLVEMILNFVNHEGQEYTFAFVRDISDRKQKEENLKKEKEKAEEADKLKSAFLANMSHEIRTPMNAIIGFSNMLVQEDFLEAEKQEFASIIKSSGDTLLKLIDDIINISLIEAGQLKFNSSKHHLNSLLKEIHLSFQGEKIRQDKQHIDIRLYPINFDNQITIETDKVRFQQILTNLVGNALKFTDSGYIEIGYHLIGKNKLTLWVKDTGIGIPKEKISLIFERFSKINDDKKLYSGTGLGLTISKKLVEQMGGMLTVESEYGKGSVFKFTVPYEVEAGTGKNTSLNKIKSENGIFDWKGKSLLIVEDVESNFLFLETALKKTGIKIHWAKNGMDAITYCKTTNPDAILMDIQLPGKNGYEVTREILTISPAIPIIAQTAYAFNDEKEKMQEAGCVDCLTKPINTQKLYETIKKHIG